MRYTEGLLVAIFGHTEFETSWSFENCYSSKIIRNERRMREDFGCIGCVTFFWQDLHIFFDILVFFKQQYHFLIIQLCVTISVSQYSLHIHFGGYHPGLRDPLVRLLNVTFWLV